MAGVWLKEEEGREGVQGPLEGVVWPWVGVEGATEERSLGVEGAAEEGSLGEGWTKGWYRLSLTSSSVDEEEELEELRLLFFDFLLFLDFFNFLCMSMRLSSISTSSSTAIRIRFSFFFNVVASVSKDFKALRMSSQLRST